MSDPTPLPWAREALMLIGANGDTVVHFGTSGGRHLGPESEANAILTHKAVSMHERLVHALKVTAELWEPSSATAQHAFALVAEAEKTDG